MSSIVEEFTRRAAEFDKEASRRPPGEPEDIKAPNLLDYEIVRGAGSNTDKALSDLFFRTYRHLFCNGNGNLQMFLITSNRWTSEALETHIHSHVIHLSGLFYAELRDVENTIRNLEAAGNDNDELGRQRERRTALHKIIIHCEKSRTIGAVAKMVHSKLKTLLDGQRVQMNADPELLVCKNGAVNLRTGQIRWPRLDDYITKNTGVDYVPGVDTSWWRSTVMTICGGDERLAAFLQVWFGYCATGHTREHCMAVMWGNGRNGKNLIIEAVAAAIGKYATALSASFLEQQGSINSGSDNNQLYMMAQLDGTRLAYVSETGERGKLKESTVKSLTGDKTVRARLAYENFYEFELTHKFTVGTNHKPEVSGTDDGVWERIRLVPMRVKFGDEGEVAAGLAQHLKDPKFLDMARAPEVREQVLAWIVEGARTYLGSGLSSYTPASVAAETKVYRREQDTLGQFLQAVSTWVPFEECVRVQERSDAVLHGPNRNNHGKLTDEQLLLVDKMDLWRTYALWAEDNGHKAMSSTMFARRITSAQRFWMQDAGVEQVMKPLEAVRMSRGNRYRYFRWNEVGLILRDHARRTSKIQFEGKHEPGKPDF